MDQMSSASVPMFSVISVYNDPDELEMMLKQGLERQSSELYETIFIDNRDSKFDSAAAALNTGAERAKGEYYVFIHQDVRFESETWFEEAASYLDQVDDLGVAGITGISETDVTPIERGRNEIVHGPERDPWLAGKSIMGPAKVQTIDELCIMVPSTVFDEYNFDTNLCPSWHLYGVEYALRINYRTEYQTYVLPLDVWHKSTGMTIGTEYYRSVQRLASECSDVEMIHTTCGTWPTNMMYLSVIISIVHVINCLPFGNKINSYLRLIWGGIIPLLWEHGFEGVRGLIKEGYLRARQ